MNNRYQEFEDRLTELRKNAVALDKAMEEAKKRKTRKRLYSDEEKEKRAKSDCTFLNKPISEILESGTIYEKVSLAAYDFSRKAAGKTRPLTDEQRQQIRGSLHTEEEINEYVEFARVYDKLRAYQDDFMYIFKMYQLDLSMLQNLLTKWNNYEYIASLWSYCLNNTMHTGLEDDCQRFIHTRELLADFEIQGSESLAHHLNATLKEEQNVRFIVFGKDVKADIDFEGGLYSKIQWQAGEAVKRLRMCKAYCLALVDYVAKNRVFGLVPSLLLEAMENVRLGLFINMLTHDKEYLRSELNNRRKRGEAVTPEEEHKAVYPDFEEVEADKDTLAYCQATLLQ